jgi:excinuclease ABC subunit C
MVAENAVEGLEQLKVRQVERGDMDAAMAALQEALSLPELPRRIECYDISNIQGTNSVGSMVVFEEGKPKTAHYRRFKIKTVDGVDDYSMMREVLTRRFKRLAKNNGATAENGRQKNEKSGEDAWRILPDLVLIDGGKGHLGAALQVMLEVGADSIPLASIAKENEELFVPQTPEAIVLPRNSQALFLVQRARDEAHRFAITFHRQRRSKQSVASALDGVTGIGPKRRRMLLRRFGSVRGIMEAAVEDLAVAPGMTLKLATRLKEYL